jgi:hypothetical protein
MDKKKPFTARYDEPGELQFFSLLPLEDAAECMRQLATSYNVAIEILDEDAYRFEIYQRNIAPNPVFVKGVMQRWEGTYTRLDCETGVRQQSPDINIQPKDWVWLRHLFVVGGMMIVFLVSLQIISGIQIFVIEAIPFLLVLAGILVISVMAYHQTIPDSQWIQYTKERPILLNALKASLQVDGSIAYSPEELTEKMAMALEAENRLSESGTS